MDLSGGARLRSFIERIERLEEDKMSLMDDIKDVFAEAKSSGFDIKVMRQVLRMRKMKVEDRRELEELLDHYMHALCMIEGTQSPEEEQAA